LILWMVERWLSWNITTSWSQKQPFKEASGNIYFFSLFYLGTSCIASSSIWLYYVVNM
jgi:hypothetical protein